jgi:hypothetical protein
MTNKLLLDILEDELDKDMENEVREDMIVLLYELLDSTKENWLDHRGETIRRI